MEKSLNRIAHSRWMTGYHFPPIHHNSLIEPTVRRKSKGSNEMQFQHIISRRTSKSGRKVHPPKKKTKNKLITTYGRSANPTIVRSFTHCKF